MAEALDSTFQDYGPVRFPLPQGHPLFQDEEALEAALLQDALEGVAFLLEEDVAAPASQQRLGWIGAFGRMTTEAIRKGTSWLPPLLEPEVALQEMPVRNQDPKSSKKEMDRTSASSDTEKSEQFDSPKTGDGAEVRPVEKK